MYCFKRVARSETRSAPSRRGSAPNHDGRNRRIVRLSLLFFALLIVVDAVVGDRGMLALLDARRQHSELAAGLARQRVENARLREQARRLREDPSAIEEIARRDLGLIRPGEKVFIVKDLPPPARP